MNMRRYWYYHVVFLNPASDLLIIKTSVIVGIWTNLGFFSQLRFQSEEDDGDRVDQLDLHSLAELQSQGVPHTDDLLKYGYSLGSDGQYGTVE